MSKTVKITIVSILVVLLIFSSLFISNTLNKPNIYNGVKIEDIDVSGLSKSDAKGKLSNKLDKSLASKEILIAGDGYSRNVTYGELEVRNDYDTAVNKAYKIGREGNMFSRLQEISNVKSKGKNIDLAIIKNNDKAKEIAQNIDTEITQEKKEATLSLLGGNFIVTEEVIGKKVDKELLEKKIDEGINNVKSIDIPIEFDQPRATKALLSQVKEEIGSYSTNFKLNDANRVYNIKRASNSIDGSVILPGDTFSFNNTTGPRSLRAGYKEATVIMNGEFVPGEGGGVCQVSSTLYNTLLNSKVNIVERHSHSLPISYVPPGRDATVAYDVLDLKFKNDHDFPVYIKSNVVGNTLIVKVYGSKEAKS